ncbi:MAG: CehA/McbA family metallohydrolase [Acidobacteriota bacterium]
MNTKRLTHLVLASVGLVSFSVCLEAHKPLLQEPPRAASDIPACQLFHITRTPPQDWRLEGVLASSDFGRLLLRHREAGAHVKQLDDIVSRTRDYKDESFEAWHSPHLIKVLVEEQAIRVVRAPGELIMPARTRYQFPIMVKNTAPAVRMLTIESPWRTYEFPVPGRSVRGYCLNVWNPEPGRKPADFSFRAGEFSDRIRLTLDIRAKGRLRVRLIGDEGVAAAARVYLSGVDKLAYMPYGAAQRIMPRTGEYFFYARDTFEVSLPEGEALVQAVGGLEFAPVEKAARVEANKVTTLDLTLDHRFPLYKQGWYSSDSHIHANYFDNELVTVDDIALQVAGEGLDIANLMVANSTDEHVHDLQHFEGKPHRLSHGRHILYWNEEMRNRLIYGHMSFYNLKELVYPIYTGYPGTEHYEDYPPNYYQAAKARAQGGVVAYVHPAIGTTFDRVGYGGAQEFPVDIVLGEVDSLDVLSNTLEPPAVDLWYRILNTGLSCAISAGTDSFTNFMMYWVPGSQRVYVHVPGPFSYQKWIDNYRKGVSFATNGPILKFSVNDQLPGSRLQLSKKKGRATVRIQAEVQSLVPVDKLEIVVNGSVVASEAIPGGRSHRLQREINLEKSSWVAARVWGPGHRLVPDDPQAFAHTSAVYCMVHNRPIASAEDSLFWADWIEQLIKRVTDHGVFATPERRDSVIELFRKAQARYREMAREAGSN